MKKPNAYEVSQLFQGTPENVIHKEDFSLYDQDFEFHKHINKDEALTFFYKLPLYQGSELRRALMGVIVSGQGTYEKVGIYHCDTQSRGDSWRAQLHINLRIFPEAALLLAQPKKDSLEYLAFFSGNDCVVLTFNIKKK